MSLDQKVEPDFAKRGGLVVAIAQEVATKQVLMQAYMNREAWAETLKTGYATYWSTSRNELWRKGATSGDWQPVKEIYVDCDSDAVLLVVEQQGKGACHTGNYSCFYTKVF
ncbi:phosphoribosyl-AMP cyclohydrolase [Candidatus Woesearchaeota archaeon]|nr:phosphoribosyl-AMP cyclohydrolase [Candidatus Woesearchaeota archaeon]